MNTNETNPMTNNFRLNRIKKVSKCFRLFLQYGFPLMLVVMIIVAVIQGVLKGQQTKPEDFPHGIDGVFIVKAAGVLLWTLVALVTLLVWYWTLLKFFRFLEKGMLFTSETASCLKIIGFTCFATIIAGLGLYFCNPLPNNSWPSGGPIGDISAGIYDGAFFIFLGWLFDEAHKIREEQELTV